jgi:hypothetical protein
LLAIVAILLIFLRCGFGRRKKSNGKNGIRLCRSIMLQNIDIAHDPIATADRVADHTQRIINLKN